MNNTVVSTKILLLLPISQALATMMYTNYYWFIWNHYCKITKYLQQRKTLLKSIAIIGCVDEVQPKFMTVFTNTTKVKKLRKIGK